MDHKKIINEFFSKQCAEHHDQGWKTGLYDTPDNQYGTFVNLTKIIPPKESGTFLDVGCGQGELYEFIDTRGIDVIYTGIDLCPTMIGYAKARFLDGNFEIQDLLEYDKQYDYIIAANAMNLKLPESQDLFVQEMIEKMFKLARKGIAFNLYSDIYLEERKPEIYYYSPSTIFSFCLKLTPNIFLNHYCSGYDFCVYMYKN